MPTRDTQPGVTANSGKHRTLSYVPAPKALFSLESEGFLFGKHKKKPLRNLAGAAGEK